MRHFKHERQIKKDTIRLKKQNRIHAVRSISNHEEDLQHFRAFTFMLPSFDACSVQRRNPQWHITSNERLPNRGPSFGIPPPSGESLIYQIGTSTFHMADYIHTVSQSSRFKFQIILIYGVCPTIN